MDTKRIIFVCITKNHYQMAIQILKEFRALEVNVYTKIFCSGFLHNQKDNFCADTLKLFDENCFINEFQYIVKRNYTWKLRPLIRKVRQQFDHFKADMIITFTDNSYIYQHAFSIWKSTAKIVLFHEGYGDYSAPTNTLREKIPYLLIQVMVWPYTFNPVFRSYTGLYDYSFLLQPNVVERDFSFRKFQIPAHFLKSIYYKEKMILTDIAPNSILFTLSGKDWANNKRLKQYLLDCIRQLQPLFSPSF